MGVLGAVLLVAASLVVQPMWPVHWYAWASRSPYARVAALTFVGPVLLLAVLRWRRPEARLLLVMACVPHTLFWYDEMLIWLVAVTSREAVMPAALSGVGYILWHLQDPLRSSTHPPVLQTGAPWLVAFVYLPCLVMVLRRPNEGDVPAWMERLVAAAGKYRPRWMAAWR